MTYSNFKDDLLTAVLCISKSWLLIFEDAKIFALENCLEVKLPTKFNTDGGMIYGIPMVARDGTS